ncbi:hypothetical protein [Caballeronia cordobensis]|nr:hypothetical protein [Caballeronia cordobensis]
MAAHAPGNLMHASLIYWLCDRAKKPGLVQEKTQDASPQTSVPAG